MRATEKCRLGFNPQQNAHVYGKSPKNVDTVSVSVSVSVQLVSLVLSDGPLTRTDGGCKETLPFSVSPFQGRKWIRRAYPQTC